MSIEYKTVREAAAAIEGFERGKRKGFLLARAQITQEIMAQHSVHCRYQVQHFSEQGYNDFSPSSLEIFDRCSHVDDAAIAGREGAGQ